MTSTEVLTAIAPEVAARVDADTWLVLAAGQLYSVAWGANYTLGVCYLAAHMATLAPLDVDEAAAGAVVAGPITSKGAGDLSESYGSATSGVSGITTGDAALMLTKYGREFIRLRNTRAARTATVIRS